MFKLNERKLYFNLSVQLLAAVAANCLDGVHLLLVFTYIFNRSHVRFVPSLDFYHEVIFHVLILRRRRKQSVMMNI